MLVNVVFARCQHNPKNLSRNISFRYAVLSFSVLVDGTRYDNLSCLVQHPYDTDESNLIISPPATYSGPFDLFLFRACARDYYELCSPPVADPAAPKTERVVVREKAYSFETNG